MVTRVGHFEYLHNVGCTWPAAENGAALMSLHWLEEHEQHTLKSLTDGRATRSHLTSCHETDWRDSESEKEPESLERRRMSHMILVNHIDAR